MNVKKGILPLLLFLCAQFMIAIFLINSVQPAKLNMVKLNELLHECEQAWPKLISGQTPSMPISEYNYALLDGEGRLLYTTAKHESPNENEKLTLQTAIQERDTIVDLFQQNQSVGKLVLFNEYGKQADLQKNRMMTLLGIDTMLLLLYWLIYTRYLDKYVFRPFRRLKEFAAHVANGNLDIPLSMDKNNAFGAFSESFDLMRDELRRAKEMERSANQSKKELVAKLSHDIKTPIASIKAVSEVMAVSTQNEKEIQQLGVIEAKADQVDTLISNLFHATLEELQELDVNPAEQSSPSLRLLLMQADYLGAADIGPIPECLVLFDPLRLQQVFDNLIGNSYKYAKTAIQITASMSSKTLTICFRDFGPGLAPEELPLIFEKYYRGCNASGKSGSGLGLYISHYLMEKMEGNLTCCNLKDGFCAYVILRI